MATDAHYFNSSEISTTSRRLLGGTLEVTSTRSPELLDRADALIFIEYGEAVLGVKCPPELAPMVERIRQARLGWHGTPEALAAREAQIAAMRGRG